MATDNFTPSKDYPVRPEADRCIEIIEQYQSGRLTLEAAAPQLLAAMQGNPSGFNFVMAPSIRTLLAEVHRIAGWAPPDFGPVPNRHTNGDQRILDLIAQAWWAVFYKAPPNTPRSIAITFAASNEARARTLAEWLRLHGNHLVQLESPAEADADDWMIRAQTPATRWTQATVTRWAESLREAPCAGDASLEGWSVRP